MDIREFLPSSIQNQTPGSGVALATPSFSQDSTRTPTPVISDSELTEHDLGLKINGPAQPRLSSYPKSKFGSQKRSFQATHYSCFPFLENSVQKIQFFCFSCKHFPTPNADTAFTKVGVKNWKKIKEKLQQHAKCRSHIDSQRSWIEFQPTSSAGSVATQLSKNHSEKVAANRTYAKQIINILLYLGKQGLSLRGHNETTSSSNRENFLELCDWYAKRDKVFCQLYNSPRNFTSPSIQNKLIEIAAFQVQNEILKRIIENGFYTNFEDEARSFKQEQMTICVRFVNALDLNVEERFVGFVNSSKKVDAVAIYYHIKFFLQKGGIYELPIVAQGYDGADLNIKLCY